MKTSYDRTMAAFDLRKPWLQALLLAMCIPLFPEYIAPLLAVASFLCALRDIRRRRRPLRVGAAGSLLMLYIAYMLLHLLFADSLVISAATVAGWAIMFLLYLALSNVLINQRRMETVLFLLSLIAGICGLLACVQYAANAIFGWSMPLQIWDFVDERVYALLPFNVTLHSIGIRAASTFSNPNIFAEYAIMATPFVAAYAFSGERSPSKIISRLSLILIVLGILFSFSRGCYLALFAIAVVMCIANIRRLIPILIVAASVFLLIPDAVFERLMSLNSNTDIAILERFDVWGATMEQILQRPLFGHGAGIGSIWAALSASGISAPHAHNLMLEWFDEGGIVAVVLLFFLIWKLFRIGFELVMHTHRTRMLGAATIAFCVGFFVCGMFDYPLFSPKLVGMFMMLLGIGDALGSLDLGRPRLPLQKSLPFYDTVTALIAAIRRRKRRSS